MRKIFAAVLATASATVLFMATPAGAVDGPWNPYTGTTSNWHCGSTVTIRPGFQAQSCIVVSGTNYQGATIISLTSATTVMASTRTWEAGSETLPSRECFIEERPVGRSVCFNATRSGPNGDGVQAVSSVSDDIAGKEWVSPTVIL
ncbi:hypothetical protein [Streptomyces sp. UNOB3_S3]|uniref:hypothetical protein n=1 Tax=Streptomyces sp. UNOB3_S3 TaxID=2871682 RepID=UPI001E492E53|nr:hypothetical protein [Streptomyces sp. UNOB3_S3]MCC3775185.1 hypothetical protein [Streptomyces sp. UNOB3_S3]